jgi:hypothetical protein
MDECRISNPLARFLIQLVLRPALYQEYQADKTAVMNRAEFGLSAEDKAALSTNDDAAIRFRLDNIQIHP